MRHTTHPVAKGSDDRRDELREGKGTEQRERRSLHLPCVSDRVNESRRTKKNDCDRVTKTG